MRYPYGGRQNPRYIYTYKRKTKENTYANKICKTKEREKKSITDYNKQKGLRAYKSKLKQNKTA